MSAEEPSALAAVERATRARFRLALAALSVVLVGGTGCTDDAPTDTDTQGPEVRILFPPDLVDPPWYNEDLDAGFVDVFVAARDDESVPEVSVLFSSPYEAHRRLIGKSDEPVPISSVPEGVRERLLLPQDWFLYRIRWNTLSCGTKTLFANAVDASGNAGFADAITVLQLDRSCFDFPPVRPDFRVVPPEGPVTTDFVFDAIGEDPENPLSQFGPFPLNRVRTRWDFDSDGTWDIGWDDGAVLTERQTHRYGVAGAYRARLQARIPILEEPTVVIERAVVVTPIP